VHLGWSSGRDSESGTSKSAVQGSGVDVLRKSNDNDAPTLGVLSSVVAVEESKPAVAMVMAMAMAAVMAKIQDFFGFQEKLDQLGSVCMSRKEEFVQAEINHPRCNHRTSRYLCQFCATCAGRYGARERTSFWSSWGRRFIVSSPTTVLSICSITSTRSVLPPHTHGTLKRASALSLSRLPKERIHHRQLHPFAVQNKGVGVQQASCRGIGSVEAVVLPLGVCRCSSGRSPCSRLCLGTGFSSRRAPVVPSARRVARARHGKPARSEGIGLKFANEERHDLLREEAISLWGTKKCQFAG